MPTTETLDERMQIRVKPSMLADLEKLAEITGLKVQDLIRTALHRYIREQLPDASNGNTT